MGRHTSCPKGCDPCFETRPERRGLVTMTGGDVRGVVASGAGWERGLGSGPEGDKLERLGAWLGDVAWDVTREAGQGRGD